MGILIPKPSSIHVDEMQRTSMYFLPCRKSSGQISQTLSELVGVWTYGTSRLLIGEQRLRYQRP
jgi:hypothetical protein